MKRFSTYILVLGLSLLVCALPGLAGEGRGQGRGQRGIERLQSELNLSQEQLAQLQPLFEQQRARHKARFEAMKAQLDGILTPEQKTRLEQLKAERQAQRGERKPGEGGPRAGHGKRGSGFAQEFAEKLGLTAEQQTRLKELREQGKQEMQAEKAAFQSRLAQVLTPEQQAKWEQLKQRRHRGPGKPQQG